jgi:hypothetical protein
MVARRFELSRRRDTLSLQHHAEVCALPDELQDKWLDLAAANRWSKQELRRRLRETADRETGAGVWHLRLSVDRERQQRWREAASSCGCSFDDWVIRSLDAAASGRPE